MTNQDNPLLIVLRQKQVRLTTLHKKYIHLSFSRLQLLPRTSIIPKELASIPASVYPGCTYGKSHRRPWRYKGIKNLRKIRSVTRPVETVSIDHLVSPIDGFVPTHRGTLTINHYIGDTLFANHFSNITYAHLITEMNGETTVEAKKSFERDAATHNVKDSH